MYDNTSFGSWLKNRRKELDFTREELAHEVGCSPIMIYKIESAERRPSKQIASLLAHKLQIPELEIDSFIKFARQSDAANVTHSASIKGISPSITPLIGRDSELLKIENMLFTDHNRLITLVGSPGVGKTSLAVQVLRNVADLFDDESYFVSLVSLNETEAAASTIAVSLGLQEVTGQSPTEQITHFFANRMSLLVIDNFEHLLERKALIAGLHDSCPMLHIIMTSRAALKLEHETVFRVRPLKTPDFKYPIRAAQLVDYSSIDLFVHYARAVQPSFALTDDNALSVAQICYRLEGIPLAIVLAAARVKTFRPEILFQHLEKRLGSVTTGRKSVNTQHQTLRDALSWSYDLLTMSQQQLFAKLAIFVNGSTFEAVEHVCRENDEDMLTTLEALVDHNIVNETQDDAGQTRFCMLETIREYALEKLDEVSAYQADSLKRAHAEYFLSLAEQADPFLRTKDQLIWLKRLGADQDNFEAALEWSQQSDKEINLRLAGALGWFWYVSGKMQRGTYWLKLATQNVQNAPLRYRAKALLYITAIGTKSGDFQWAFDAGEEAVRLYRILQDDRMLAQALIGTLSTHLGLGYQDKLEAIASEGIALAERTNDTYTSAVYGLQTAFMQSDPNIKIDIIEKLIPAIRETGERWLLNTSLIELGHIYLYKGDYPHAEEILRECLKSCREISDMWIAGWALGALGEARFYQGDSTAAVKMIIEGLELSRSIYDTEGCAVRLTQLAAVFDTLGHSDFAAHLLGNVSGAYTNIGQLAREMHVARYNNLLNKAREHLTGNAFSAAWNAGKIMKLEQVIEYALSYTIFVANLV
ncbi:MAG: helix-turn-helix domain-containing protein [Anaerolineaceae bacterium]|nr:helix-turn-helix domain-containing protein [Anaerolineaceae bacterium]